MMTVFSHFGQYMGWCGTRCAHVIMGACQRSATSPGTSTSLSAPDLEWLHSLVSDWQLLADLSFADLILWVPLRAPAGALSSGWVAVAQMRPTTCPRSYPDDLVGTVLGPGTGCCSRGARRRRFYRESDPVWLSGVPVRAEALPVTRQPGHVRGVIARAINLTALARPAGWSSTYLAGADDLARMLSEGTFPYPGRTARWSARRGWATA